MVAKTNSIGAAEGSIPTRESLLGRLKDWADQESWCDFYQTYWRLIHNVSLSAGLSREEAAEALQETMISVAHEMKRFRYDAKRGSFKHWLLKVTRSRIAEQFRTRQRNVTNVGDGKGSMTLVETMADPASVEVSENLWDEKWNQNLLAVAEERIKAKVEPRTFQAYQLYVREQWPVARVSQTVGLSKTMVYVAKHRIDRMLKKEFSRLARKAGLDPGDALFGKGVS